MVQATDRPPQDWMLRMKAGMIHLIDFLVSVADASFARECNGLHWEQSGSLSHALSRHVALETQSQAIRPGFHERPAEI
jgi:hypothetical protein